MKDLETLVKEVVEDEMHLTYYFERWDTINLLWDKAVFPSIAYILPTAGVMTLGNYITDAPNCFIAFSVKNELDFTAKEAKEKIERCFEMAKEFFFKLNKHLPYPITGDIPYTIAYSQTDTTAISVIYQLSITGPKECYPKGGDSLKRDDCGCESSILLD